MSPAEPLSRKPDLHRLIAQVFAGARKHENASSGNHGTQNSENLKNKDFKQDEFESDDENDGSRVIEMGKELSIHGTVNVTKDKKPQKQTQSAKKWLDDQTRERKSSAIDERGNADSESNKGKSTSSNLPENAHRGRRLDGPKICPEQR